jgi:hypothetical protein
MFNRHHTASEIGHGIMNFIIIAVASSTLFLNPTYPHAGSPSPHIFVYGLM